MAELVSILIPAYNERFFPEAFASALAQRHDDFELVVCDDSPGKAIEDTVRAAGSPRVRYFRNGSRLGFAANFMRCFVEARGDLVKFLNDDDRLRPDCVGTLAGMFAANRRLTLATSRRCIIDAAGRLCADNASTQPISHVSAVMFGRELGDFVLVNALNLIGEPTTAMFRRSQLPLEGDALFRWGGTDYHCLADLSMWLRLLAKGFAYYDAGVLSEYRMHAGQEQDRGDMRVVCLEERLWIARQARRAGFLSTPVLWRQALLSVRARAGVWDEKKEAPESMARVHALVREVDTELERSPP